MVEKSEFKDHAELGRDPEILSMLDKARNGKVISHTTNTK
jgi:hypothetical protein